MTTAPTPRTIVLTLLAGAMVALAALLIMVLRDYQATRHDLAELHNVKYGLLNADVWVEQMSAILDKKIGEFELSAEQRVAAKANLETMLDILITEADRYMRAQNLQGKWWQRTRGKIKQGVQDVFIDMDTVKAAIPQYADRILAELDTPDGRAQLRGFLRELLTDVSAATFAAVDTAPLREIEARYACPSRILCEAAIQQRLTRLHLRAVQLALTALTVMSLMLGLAWRGRDSIQLGLLATACAVLMACGVLTPMIEVEARITELSFVLLGESMRFADQVLYFQSKSVLDVVQVLTATRAPDMVLVGILIMSFSVIFPLAKLATSMIYLADWRGLRQSKLVHFFALKSGKWSMADVMVVAIFMAYIGFDGLITSQLSNFASAAGQSVDVLTTNGTSLQIGFFMFLAFCVASLLTASLIEAAFEDPDAAD